MIRRLLLALLLVAGPAFGVGEPSHQNGTVTITAAAASATDTLTAVVLADTLMLYSFEGAGDSTPDCDMISGEITDTTTLTFERTGTTGCSAINVQWWTMEWATGVTVQRGSFNCVSAGNPADTTITAVTLAQSWPVVSVRRDGSNLNRDDFFTAHLTTTTNLQTEFFSAASGTCVLKWQVVDYTSASVQTTELTWSLSDTTKDWTMSSALLDDTIMSFSHRVGGTGQRFPDRLLFRNWQVNSTTVRTDRSNSGSIAAATRHQAVTLPASEVSVQTIDFAFGTGDATKDVEITAVTQAESIIVASGMQGYGWGKTAYSADDNLMKGIATFAFVDADTVRATRGVTGDAADYKALVIDFDQGGAPPARSRGSVIGARQ